MFKLAHDFWFASNNRFGRCPTLIAIFKSLRRTSSLVIEQAKSLEDLRLERIAQQKVRRRQLTNDSSIEVTGQDLGERSPAVGQRDLFECPLGRANYVAGCVSKL